MDLSNMIGTYGKYTYNHHVLHLNTIIINK